MYIKSSQDLISSLRGASFRKITFDGQTRTLSSIKTLRSLHGRYQQHQAQILLSVPSFGSLGQERSVDHQISGTPVRWSR